MLILADENVPEEYVSALRGDGHDVVSSRDVSELGPEADDSDCLVTPRVYRDQPTAHPRLSHPVSPNVTRHGPETAASDDRSPRRGQCRLVPHGVTVSKSIPMTIAPDPSRTDWDAITGTRSIPRRGAHSAGSWGGSSSVVTERSAPVSLPMSAGQPSDEGGIERGRPLDPSQATVSVSGARAERSGALGTCERGAERPASSERERRKSQPAQERSDEQDRLPEQGPQRSEDRNEREGDRREPSVCSNGERSAP